MRRLNQRWVWVGLVFGLGLALRLYQLGHSSLWFDEAGVALAATSPTLAGMLAVMKTHVMAMPLDYLVAWGMAHVCSSDACLRLPSAIWGSLTLLVVYALLLRLTAQRYGQKLALVGMLFLALAPIHVYYSQELRFYAALFFFYMLSTLLWWEAVRDPSPRRWAAAGLVTALGGYFHVYVLFALSNAFFWLITQGGTWVERRRAWAGFILSALGVIAALLPGYLAFAPNRAFEGSFDPALAIVSLLSGLGWYPNYPTVPGLWLIAFALLIAFQVIGLYRLVRAHERAWLAWTISTAAQVMVILVLDAAWHYWINPRQFLQFLPWACFLAAVGLLPVEQPASAGTSGAPASYRTWVMAALLGGFLCASLPVFASYYQLKKSLGREISQALVQVWQPGETVLVYAPEYPILYQYYLNRAGRADIAAACVIAEDQAPAALPPAARQLRIYGPVLGQQVQQDLIQSGFQPLPVPGEVPGLQTLWGPARK